MTQREFNIGLLRKGELICRNSQFCKGKEVGIHGRMFGGDLVSEIDSVCAVFAAEVCDTPWIVTKTMNIEFISEVKPNQIYKTCIFTLTTSVHGVDLQDNLEIAYEMVHYFCFPSRTDWDVYAMYMGKFCYKLIYTTGKSSDEKVK